MHDYVIVHQKTSSGSWGRVSACIAIKQVGSMSWVLQKGLRHSLSQRMTWLKMLNIIQLLQFGVCVPPVDLQIVIIYYPGL